MPETKAAEAVHHHHDKRVLVLLLIGLCLGLAHLCAFLDFAYGPRQQQKVPRLLWLETSAGAGNGLYWLDDEVLTWPRVLTALGQSSFSGPLPPLRAEMPVAYRLSSAGPPRAISLPAPLAPLFFQPIPINQASAEVLMTIPGIGRRLAGAIIMHRAKRGGIKDQGALMAIEGIGAKKAAIIADFVRFE